MRWHRLAALPGAALLLAGNVALTLAVPATSTVTLTFVGDVMLGRGVERVAVADPDGVFRDVRHLTRASDLTFANLESPLTARPHRSPNPNDLTADPAMAGLLASAGFDVLSVANNHAGDAGPDGLAETADAIETAGMRAVGHPNEGPLVVEIGGLRIAVVALDTSSGPGSIEATLGAAVEKSDIVVVSVHGGVEYLPEADPRIRELAERLVDSGADVVWGHGPHVSHPITTIDGIGDRTALVATSLGNFLFDQRGPLTGQGTVLQVRVGADGVVGYRTGLTSHHDLRVHFDGWELPVADAVLWDGEWWTPTRGVTVEQDGGERLSDFSWGEVVAADRGRIFGDEAQVVVAFRHVPGPHPVRDGLPTVTWTDTDGRSHHLGIYRADDLTPLWVAGMVPAPIVEIAACHGSMAFAYGTLDDRTVVSAGAAVWRPTGLEVAAPLPRPGSPACADLDGDGRTEPVVVGH